jgi:AAA family ATP:ADP antiporter
MMVIKGMSYALNNPTKEILYQMTSINIKFKCKSWIDTFGQRGRVSYLLIVRVIIC